MFNRKIISTIIIILVLGMAMGLNGSIFALSNMNSDTNDIFQQNAYKIDGNGKLVSSENGEAITEKNFDPEKVYHKNKDGQTYGSALYAISPETEPDLIVVKNADGIVGYVYQNALYEPDPKNPEEALAMQKLNEGKSRKIPMYESDGKTVLGSFELLPSTVTLKK